MSIIIDHITKKYGDLIVLDDFSAKIEDGAILCIMGSSGAGKTTLLNILVGLCKPDCGIIITKPKEVRYSMVFQENRLCESFDAFTNIKMVVNKKMLTQTILEQLKRIGIFEPIGKPISEFSGGMKRRVAILRALLVESDMIVMDEPLKGLDKELKLFMIDYIKEKRCGRTLLIVTHDRGEALDFGADILEIDSHLLY